MQNDFDSQFVSKAFDGPSANLTPNRLKTNPIPNRLKTNPIVGAENRRTDSKNIFLQKIKEVANSGTERRMKMNDQALKASDLGEEVNQSRG